MEAGKVFVGGISWETTEQGLTHYFQTFGHVVQAVIIKDRSTGRARGFGFINFADPAVAHLVVQLNHIIDGRPVEAKKAVPKDDQHILNRNQCSPIGNAHTKKIFVGGLASTVTEGNLKRYFDQFGTITDVVVMYDHNTQRPRGFGFITYDSEEAVDRALVTTFHELNGKMVEVKRAVPRELSPTPIRTSLGAGPNALIRVTNFLNGFPHGFSPSPVGAHGVRIDERSAPTGFSSFTPNFGAAAALNYEPRMSPSYNETSNLFPNLSFEQGLNALHKSNATRLGGFSEREAVSKGTGFDAGSSSWSLWGNTNSTSAGNTASMSFGIGAIESDILKSSEAIRSAPLSVPAETRRLSSDLGLSYACEGVKLGSAAGLYGRGLRSRTPPPSSFSAFDCVLDAKFDDFYSGGGDQSQSSAPFGLKGSSSFEFGLGNVVSDVPLNKPAGLCW